MVSAAAGKNGRAGKVNINTSPARLLLGLYCVGLLCLTSCSAPAPVAEPPAISASATLPVADLLKQADEAYAGRANLDRVREGLKALKRIRAVEPGHYEAAWRARLNYTLGDHTKDEKERKAAFLEGIEAGKVAARVGADKPDGHFWLGANYGGNAQVEGPLTGLSAAKEMRRLMETVLKIDEGYQGGSAFMVLGRLDTELPEMLGGDRKRAIETLERGLKHGEYNSLLRLRLAVAYREVKRNEDARREANFILKMKPHPDFMPEYQESVEGARDLLNRL